MAAAAAALLWCAAAFAEVRGIYWDPDVNGEGWTFDAQDDVVAITWYRYEDGEPAFRTILASTEYATIVNGDGTATVRQELSGRVYRTANGETVDVGAFSGVFFDDYGVVSGTVDAAGVQRDLEPFVYAYAAPAERFRGLWTFSYESQPAFEGGEGVTGTAAYARFLPETGYFDDGTPFRDFVLSDGRSGYLFYYPDDGGTYGSIFNADASFIAFSWPGIRESNIGGAALFTQDVAQVTPYGLMTATSITQSDKEAPERLASLGFPDLLAKRVVHVTDAQRHASRQAALQLRKSLHPR
jgi:hypothetical protein